MSTHEHSIGRSVVGVGISLALGVVVSLVATAATALAAAVLIDFSTGFSAASAQMTLNGSAKIAGSTLRLTDGGSNEAGSAFTNTPVDVATGFVSNFTVQLLNGTVPSADGMTFVLQRVAPSALGPSGGGLGYGPVCPLRRCATMTAIDHSIAIKLDLFDNAGEGTNSTGLYTNGASPTVPTVNLNGSGIDLHAQHVLQVLLNYDPVGGGALTESIKDTTTGATFNDIFNIDIPSVIGGNTAFAGFTAGTSEETATQVVQTWTYQISFAGAPGNDTCIPQSVSTLKQQFGNLEMAAASLGFPSAGQLQAAIHGFCS